MSTVPPRKADSELFGTPIPKKRKKAVRTELDVHKEICAYLKEAYPEVIFWTDMSGLRVTMGQAMLMKQLRSDNGVPDLFLAHSTTGYNGLFIELKREGVKLFKRNGEDYVNEHIQEQSEMIRKLVKLGYAADFAIGTEAAKKLIDAYMGEYLLMQY